MATTSIAVGTMKAAQISKAGGGFEIVEREIPTPGAGQVRIKVQACGICHSDVFTERRLVAGHSVSPGSGTRSRRLHRRSRAGRFHVEERTTRRGRLAWRTRRYLSGLPAGRLSQLPNLQVPGISYDGGYQQYMLAPIDALVAIPESLSAVEAAPLLCAGITTFNSLRHSGAFLGTWSRVQGVGGLGHLGIQFANKFGYKVAAIGRGAANAALATTTGSERLYRQRSDQAGGGTAKAGRRASDSGYGARLQSYERADRRIGAKRQAHRRGRCVRSDRGHAGAAHFRESMHSGLGRRLNRRRGGYAALLGIKRACTP